MDRTEDADSDNEISCDVHVTNLQKSDAQDSLDWSVSGISVASALDPDGFPTARYSSASDAASLDLGTPPPPRPNGDELKRLEGQFKSLEENLRSIREKSFTPTNSPRRPTKEHTKRDEESTLTQQDVTPPVKDPGPSHYTDEDLASVAKTLDFKPSVQTKLDQMRSVLKELESARLRFAASRDSQQTTKGSSLDSEHHKNKGRGRLSDYFPENTENVAKNVAKEIVKSRGTQSEPEVLQKKDCLNDVSKSTKATDVEQLKEVIRNLERKVDQQSSTIEVLKKQNDTKDSVLSEMNSRFSKAMINLTNDQKELAEKLKASAKECDRLRFENNAANQQFRVCQDELAKALHIASEFRQKLDDEEGIKQDMLNELLSERSTKTKLLQSKQAKIAEVSFSIRGGIDNFHNSLLATTSSTTA